MTGVWEIYKRCLQWISHHKVVALLCVCALVEYCRALTLPFLRATGAQVSFVNTAGPEYTQNVGGNPSKSGCQDVGSDFQRAANESFGFFTDISEKEWSMLKERVVEVQPNMCDSCKKGQTTKDIGKEWFQNNFEPEFACRFEKRVGSLGDGGKWICDPHRYGSKKSCLVYSVGSDNDFSFEREVKKVLGMHCEVHTFDPDDYSEGAEEVGSIYHQWGISNKMETNNSTVLKTLRQTAKELGHIGQTIDIFKIDCEGCELDSWETWVDSATVGVHLQQVLVEIHALRGVVQHPTTENFFKGMHQNGYVIFHKEPNTLAYSNCVEYAFLKLAPSFFNTTR